MTRVVFNNCFGGFGLSTTAAALYAKRKGVDSSAVYDFDIPRHDPDLLAVIDQLGLKNASGVCSKLEIVELTAGNKYRIEEYDGLETVQQPNCIDWITAE